MEVKRCTQAGIRINTFMMDREPTSMALAQAMMRINKGRVARPGRQIRPRRLPEEQEEAPVRPPCVPSP
jgi:hypothetical protein